MMAGNPNWWSMNTMHHPKLSSSSLPCSNPNSTSSHEFLYGSSINPSPVEHQNTNQDFPIRSWSQLLLSGGLNNGDSDVQDERYGGSLFQQQKKLENWEDQILLNLNPQADQSHVDVVSNFTRIINDPTNSNYNIPVADVKQEVSQSQHYVHHHHHELIYPNNNNNNNNIIIIRPNNPSNSWNTSHLIPHPQLMTPANSSNSNTTSCVTHLSNNNVFNYSGAKRSSVAQGKSTCQNKQDHSSECNSSNGGVSNKKARVQQSSAPPALKVRKEKLMDRITSLHQIVSPFGKTDTASVLSEAIGYIRFLQGQIEALSSPYMRNGSGNTTAANHQHPPVQERNCLFVEEPSTKDAQMQGAKDLRSRGLCLVPISCTQHVGNENGADYWAPAALGGGF